MAVCAASHSTHRALVGRGNKIATTAVARKLITRACHLLTDAQRGGEPR